MYLWQENLLALYNSLYRAFKRCVVKPLVSVLLACVLVSTGNLAYGNSPSKTLPNTHPLFSTVYDVSIKKWGSVYTPEYPWYWNKAQIVAESRLDTLAVSPVGAEGLGQFMPNTWKQMERELGFKEGSSAFSPFLNIQAQAYYMRQLRRQFKRERPEWDRHSLALASYNAGLGNVLKAQKKGGESLLYAPMIEALPLITGRHSKETKDYVVRIWSYIYEYESKGHHLSTDIQLRSDD